MNFEDFTGFFIAILAMIYFIYQSYTARAAQENADENSDEQGDVKKLLRELNIEVDEEAAERPLRQPPPKPKRVEEKVVSPQPVEKPVRYSNESAAIPVHGLGSISDHAYDQDYAVETLVLPSVIPLDYTLSSRPSRGKAIMNSLSARNDLIIIHDLMDPPKGLW